MGQTAFFLTDLIESGTLIHTGFTTAAPASNMSDDRPNVQAVAIEDNYEIDSSNDTLPFNEGAGQFNVVLTHGRYNSSNLGAHIGALMTAHPSTSLTYTVQRGGAGRWQFDATGSFEIEWDDDAVSAGLAQELGFTAAATGSGVNHTGDEARWSTATTVIADLGSAKSVEAVLVYIDSIYSGASTSNVALYMHSSYLGDTRAAWVAGASETLTLSNRPTGQTDNQIQFALRTEAATDYRYLCLSWRHFDAVDNHSIGLFKAFAATYDSANGRTVTPLSARVPFPDGRTIGRDSMYPIPGRGTWGADLRFADWEVASWRNVGHAVVRHGRTRPLFWVLDYTGNTSSGADDLALLADYGHALWAGVEAVANDDYGGQADAYISNRIRLRQVV